MLFRPSFCANCGERIERTDWGILTSRRFCQLCEAEFKGADLIPKVIVGFGALGILVGLSTVWGGSTPSSSTMVSRQPAIQKDIQAPVNPVQPQPANTTQQPKGSEAQSSPTMPRTLVSQPSPLQEKSAAEESSYYCGAETKKGSPCTRRVKGNTRCFQHKGMPAMLPPDKLKIG